MSDVVITVRGEDEERIAPELGTAHVAVRAEGAVRTEVVDALAALAAPVRASLDARETSGAVGEWSIGRMALHAERPWTPSGERAEPVHHASLDVSASFADAGDLSEWLAEISPWDGVEISRVEWRLTVATRAAVERAVAARAIASAMGRATAYAAAIGRDEVVPLEIADAGLLGRSDDVAAFATAVSADGAESTSLRPEQLVVRAVVEARFAAR